MQQFDQLQEVRPFILFELQHQLQQGRELETEARVDFLQ